MTKTIKQDSNLATLKGLMAEIAEFSDRSNLAWNRLYVATYGWINKQIQDGKHETVTAACRETGKVLNRGWKTVNGWLLCGQFMLEHGLSPTKASHASVRAVTFRQKLLPAATKAKLVRWIKAGEPSRKVVSEVAKHPNVARNESEERLRRLAKQGKLTKRQLKVEAMAVLSLARKVYGSDCVVSITDHDYNPLLELGA